MKRLPCTLLAVLCASLALALAACAPTPAASPAPAAQASASAPAAPAATPAPTPAPVTVTDDTGFALSFTAPPSRIIVMSPSECEILFALGGESKVIAVGEYCNYPEAATKKDKVGTGKNTNVEALIALKPDLIIISTMAQQKEQFDQLTSAGIKVLTSSPKTVEGTYNAIARAGALLGDKDAADKLTADMKAEFAKLAEEAKGVATKSVYIEISPLEYGLWTCGKGTFQDELMTAAGVTNVFADVQSWQQVSEEQVIARSPEYIITTMATTSHKSGDPVEEILSRKGWDKTAAVADKHVAQLNADMLSRSGPRLAQAARAIHDAVYGGQ